MEQVRRGDDQEKQMRFSTGGIRVYPWHSVNLIPQVAIVPVCNDDEPYQYASMVEVVVLGHVLHVDLPFQIARGMSTPLLGPLWSKRKKKWYRAPK